MEKSGNLLKITGFFVKELDPLRFSRRVRYRTVALRVERPWRPSEAIPGSTDTRELGVKLGEVEVASGLTIVP